MDDNAQAASVLRGEYFTAAELAADLETTIRTLDRWELNGQGPPFMRLGKRKFYRRDAVLPWLHSLETHPKSTKRLRPHCLNVAGAKVQ